MSGNENFLRAQANPQKSQLYPHNRFNFTAFDTEARRAAQAQLEFVGLADAAEKPAASLTLAMRKRLELAKALAMQPRLLLLDEVNAGLNSTEVEQAMGLIRQIAQAGVTIVLIEHLMKVVMSICTRIVVLQSGALIADGPPAQIAADERVVEAYLGKRYAKAAAASASASPSTSTS